MIQRLAVLLAVNVGLIAAAAAFAPAETPQGNDNRRICRDSGRELGSHIRATRRCRTAEQWRLEDEQKAQMPASLRVTEGQSDGRPARQPQ